MNDLMLRRREMALAGGGSEWDIEWNGGDTESPESVGFVWSKSGTATATVGTASMIMSAKGASSMGQYAKANNASVGVIEAEMRLSTVGAWSNLWFGDSEKVIGVQLRAVSGTQGLYLRNASTAASRTKLASITLSTRYVIRLVMYSNTADVYLDGALVASNVDLSTILFDRDDSIGYDFASNVSGTVNGNLYSIKAKFGRI